MKKITVLIDERLLQEAVACIGARTKGEAIEAGLRSLIDRHNSEALRRELGTFDTDLTIEELERLRNAGWTGSDGRSRFHKIWSCRRGRRPGWGHVAWRVARTTGCPGPKDKRSVYVLHHKVASRHKRGGASCCCATQTTNFPRRPSKNAGARTYSFPSFVTPKLIEKGDGGPNKPLLPLSQTPSLPRGREGRDEGKLLLHLTQTPSLPWAVSRSNRSNGARAEKAGMRASDSRRTDPKVCVRVNSVPTKIWINWNSGWIHLTL